MRRKATLLLALLAVAAGAWREAAAQERAIDMVRLDTQRSSGGFRVRVVWLLAISGEFGRIDGEVRRDRFRDTLRVDAHIDAASLRMSSPRQEALARSSEFFDVAQYPQIDFASAPFARQRLYSGGELPGRLTVRGISQPVRFNLLPADCARPARDCPLRVNGAIRRSQFGMDGHRATLADKVELDFRIYVQDEPANETLAPG